MDVSFKLDSSGIQNILNINELNKYRRAYHDYIILKKGSKGEYLLATQEYLTWLITYCNAVLKGKIFSDHQLVNQLYLTKPLSKAQMTEFVRTNLYLAKDYLAHLLGKIKENNISRYQHATEEIFIDMEWLIVHNEVVVLKKTDKARLTSSRRPYLSPTDIYSAARSLFYIEEHENIDDLYLRDLKPVVIFQIRQMLEVFGRNLLGYHEILDANSNPVKKFTQIAWEFITNECKKPNSRIHLPFSIHDIQKINSWSNSFVHETYIFSSIIQFHALRYLSVLFNGSGTGIQIYDSSVPCKFDIADIKVYQYHSLQEDFETHIKLQKPNIQIDWLDKKRVGAYIISL